jgi:hypothetical protein
MKIAVVGAGLAAECFKHYFFTFLQDSKLSVEIDQFYSKTALATTHTTTSLVARKGISRDVSPLGDLLLDAYDEWESFFALYHPLGAIKSEFKLRASKSSEEYKDFLRRYQHYTVNHDDESSWAQESGYVIDNDIFFPALVKNNERLAFNLIEKQINSEEELSAYDFVFYFTGATGKQLGLVGTCKLDETTIVSGTFLETSSVGYEDLFKDYNVFEIDGAMMIYRALSKKMLIGATSNKWDCSYNADIPGILKQYELIKASFDIPKFEDFKLVVGQRLKGVRRTPFIGPGNLENSFVANALYKNGYTVAYLAARKAVEYFSKYISN